MATQREFKGELYKQKLPINRTSGRYVIAYRAYYPAIPLNKAQNSSL